jgi:hypothetical protein
MTPTDSFGASVANGFRCGVQLLGGALSDRLGHQARDDQWHGIVSDHIYPASH